MDGEAFDGVHIIDNPSNSTESWLLATVQRQAEKAGIGMPEVGISIQHRMPCHRCQRKNSALVAVSSGLLQQMDRGEVEAVLGQKSPMSAMVIW